LEKKEKNFCLLCGKSREEPLTKMALATIEEFGEVVWVDCCQGCKVVLHNIRRIYVERQQECIKQGRMKAKSLIEVVGR